MASEIELLSIIAIKVKAKIKTETEIKIKNDNHHQITSSPIHPHPFTNSLSFHHHPFINPSPIHHQSIVISSPIHHHPPPPLPSPHLSAVWASRSGRRRARRPSRDTPTPPQTPTAPAAPPSRTRTSPRGCQDDSWVCVWRLFCGGKDEALFKGVFRMVVCVDGVKKG